MSIRSTRTSIVWVGLAMAGVCLPATAGDWPHWRGPEQTGVSRERNLPESWSLEGENLLWTNDVGGMSSPIVMNGRVYAMARVGEQQAPGTVIAGPRTQEAVVCVEAATGKRLWAYRENLTQTGVPFHRLGWSNVVGDPQTGRVYAHLVHCSLVCLDGTSGKLIWRRQLTEEFGMISTFGGRTPTPTVDEEQVIIGGVAFGWGDHARTQHRVFAFNKNTGELNWSNGTGGIPGDTSYTTPVTAVIDGQRQVITAAGDGGVHGFQARTGKKLWSYKASQRGINTTPVVDGSRIYITHCEENVNSSVLGAAMCIDVAGGTAREVWRVEGLEAGYASATIFDGRLYVLDNKAAVYCLDASTGKQLWRKNCGTIGKAALVYADGKLYVNEANGRVVILKPGKAKADVLSKVDAVDILAAKSQAREYAIFGGAAIANGRVYLQTAVGMFCIGSKDAPVAADALPAGGGEAPLESEPEVAVAQVQVRPADVLLRPGQSLTFTAWGFDAKGRSLGQVKAEWSTGQLSVPPPPSAPDAAPALVGNLQGAVDGGGKFTAQGGPHQGGAIVARVGNITGQARVRVLPELPWTFDFERSPLNKPPLTWIGAGGKFAVVEQDGGQALVKLNDFDLYYRATTNFGAADMANYTLQADVKVGHKMIANNRQMPDAGVINSSYVLVLLGNHQRLQIHVWSPTLPYSLNKTIPFEWEPEQWYTMKLRVEQTPEKAIARGKVWKRGALEPAQWTVELEDALPNRRGNPALYGHSLVGAAKSLIHYDNIHVTSNEQ